ncbi:MAG: helix-turn-helix domain-containing protein [Rhodococcus sp. (in: high G+C Gram-positive bacteria)]|uniref:TetR/AcrR family transcriptional regulator n=1 Tax=Rhodococcus sp. TaxID=1831 RepID=UPI003BB1EEB1
MPRPRTHDLGALIDAAERIASELGPAAVTLRALTDATGMSNGAIYHAFGSRLGVVGQAWLRAAERYLGIQKAAVDAALSAPSRGRGEAIDAVVAAADAPAVFAEQRPASARLLLTVRREALLGAELPDALAAELVGLDRALVELMTTLASAVWDRRDRLAVDVIHTCIVGLPTVLLLHGDRVRDPVMRRRLEAAVRAVVAVGPDDTADHTRPPTSKGLS